MIESLALLLATQGLTAVGDVPAPNPKAMSQSEIKAFNARLSRNHPYFVRCERRAETGSLVKKLFSCRTNAQWKESDEVGNTGAREMGDHFRPKFLDLSG